jgi:hypothetical protein
MCCRSRLTPVLFAGKEGKLRSKAAIVGDRKDPAQTQTALADLLRGLFHWKLDPTESPTTGPTASPLAQQAIHGFPCFRSTVGQVISTKCSGWCTTTLPWRSMSFYHRPIRASPAMSSRASTSSTFRIQSLPTLSDFVAMPEASLQSCPKVFQALQVRCLPRGRGCGPVPMRTLVPQGSPRSFQPPRERSSTRSRLKKAAHMTYLKAQARGMLP